MIVGQQLYRRAFQAYLRKGTPIEWSIRQERPTTHYVWRTRDDEKVRPGHAANDGQVFAWEDPPQTGHPGEDYGCRCTAKHTIQNLQSISQSHCKGSPTAPPLGAAAIL